MGSIRNKWTVTLALVGMVSAATAVAQPAGKTTKGASGTNAELGFQKKSRISVKDQLRQIDQYISKMKASVSSINKLAEKARTEKDMIKLNCVRDKLKKVKGHVEVAEAAKTAVQAAASRHDDAARDHEYNKLTISYPKVVALEQDAEACIGEDLAYVGKMSVVVEVDPDIAKGDPTEGEGSIIEPTDMPPLASEYR